MEIEIDKFCLYSNEDIQGAYEKILTKNIKFVDILGDYNLDLDWLPDCVQRLFIRGIFNKPLNNLHNNIIYIEIINSNYTQSFDFLPHSLKVLKLCSDINYPLDNLPSSLEYLIICGKVNIQLTNLPTKLKLLKINSEYEFPIDNFPNSIEKLYISPKYYQVIDKWPINLKYLVIHNFTGHIFNLPNIYELHVDYNISIDNVPDSIEILCFGSSYNKKLTKIPKSTKIIWLASPKQKDILDEIEQSDFLIIYESPHVTDIFDFNLFSVLE